MKKIFLLAPMFFAAYNIDIIRDFCTLYNVKFHIFSYEFLNFVMTSNLYSVDVLTFVICCLSVYLNELYQAKFFPEIVQLENKKMQEVIHYATQQQGITDIAKYLGWTPRVLVVQLCRLVSIILSLYWRMLPSLLIYFLFYNDNVTDNVSYQNSYVGLSSLFIETVIVLYLEFWKEQDACLVEIRKAHPIKGFLYLFLCMYISYLCTCLKMYILLNGTLLTFFVVSLGHAVFYAYNIY